MLHALRQSVHRTGRLLLPLLLLSWLSVVCGHCVALAGELDVPPAPHHDMAEQADDCCPSADPCIGGGCDHLADIQASVTSFQPGDHTPAVLTGEAISLPGVVVASVSLPPPAPSPGPPFPIYLRNCVFLI